MATDILAGFDSETAGGNGAEPPKQEFAWSAQQNDFFEVAANGTGNVALVARAGTGKSTTVYEGMRRFGGACVYVAFGSDIARESKAKLAALGISNGEARTSHSFGLSAIRQAYGRVEVDKEKGETIVREIVCGSATAQPKPWERGHLAALKKAFGFARNQNAQTDAEIEDAVDEAGIECPIPRPQFVAQVRRAMEMSKARPTVVDFDDMIWLPVALGLKPAQVDALFVDECLPKETPVLLADGSSLSIGEIVEGRMPVEVLAYDTRTGEQRACKVIGWHQILNQKPLVKIKARWSKKKDSNRPTNFVVCTIDHPVWADGRWVKAGEVRPGMIVQVETSAAKSQAYKITAEGRGSLSSTMSAKNDSPRFARRRDLKLKDRGSRLKIRGGNGHGPTVPERALMQALGDGWRPAVVPTGKKRGEGYPTSYKIDIANVACKVAVEVDGHSHKSRREEDAKKDALLREKGWTVVRVSNRDAVQRAAEIAERVRADANCPIDAVVESVEPVTIPDYFVYDIEVEDCHDFYANGILVHNCQDLNLAQIALLKSALKPGGRIFAVGDPLQAIYGFRGAAAGAMDRLISELDMAQMPLTVTYRCARKIVAKANEICPDLQAADAAEEGTVGTVGAEKLAEMAKPGDFVLSRTNRPLVALCLQFMRAGVKATIAGRDIGKRLTDLIKKSKAANVDALLTWIEAWRVKEVERLEARDRPVDATNDIAECLSAAAEGCASVAEVSGLIERIFVDGGSEDRVVLSSTHKAKGLERNRVFVLADTYLKKRRDKKTGEWFLPMEERHLAYVAWTRAKKELFFVQGVS